MGEYRRHNEKRRRLKKHERVHIYNTMGGKCAYCGCELAYRDMQVDHVEAFYLNGSEELDNMLPTCRSCNKQKDTYTIEGFRKHIGRVHEQLVRDIPKYKLAVRYGAIIKSEEPIVFYFEKIGYKIPNHINQGDKESKYGY